jgi:hypothetical protein
MNELQDRILKSSTTLELLLGVVDREFPAGSGNLYKILIRTKGDAEKPTEANYALVAGERDFDVHLVIRTAESGYHGIAVGKVDVAQRIVKIIEDLEGRKNGRFKIGRQAIERVGRQFCEQQIFPQLTGGPVLSWLQLTKSSVESKFASALF